MEISAKKTSKCVIAITIVKFYRRLSSFLCCETISQKMDLMAAKYEYRIKISLHNFERIHLTSWSCLLKTVGTWKYTKDP